jgi:hypothetical protein|tara:strand:+ start:1121 stop:1405 length:285 start_codon:yes stop_codon:yes gene_type:complete
MKEELIREIKQKADSIGTDTKTDRRVKGAYVDCLIMVKEALSIHSVMCIVNDAEGNTIEAKSSNNGYTELTKLNFDTIIAFLEKQKKKAPSLFE